MSIYEYNVTDRNGNKKSLQEYKGKVLLIVNTATGCGFTPQYEGLENLYKKYHDKGLEILDFPCNEFGHQAPGTDDEIHEFCTSKYNTSFDQLKKVEVNGENAEELWDYIKNEQPYKPVKGLKDSIAMKSVEKISGTGKSPVDIRWNFTKFLVDREGNVVGRYEPVIKPESMEEQIKGLL